MAIPLLRTITLLLSLGILLPTADGQVYKVKREDGSIVYTDKPVAGSEVVELGKLNQVSIPRATTQHQSLPLASDSKVSVQITSPAHEATVRNNNGIVSINATTSPANRKVQYELWFDNALTATNTTGQFTLQDVHRGAHYYYIKIKSNKGKTLASSKTQTVFVHRASILIKAN